MRCKRGGCSAVHSRRSWGRLKPPPQLGLAVLLGSISALLIVVSVLTSSIRKGAQRVRCDTSKGRIRTDFCFPPRVGQTPLLPKISATRLLDIILANRHSAHRKLQYISKLERSVTSFQDNIEDDNKD
ncbi:uncharacterized protein LOC130956423 [Arachis stenosperma]|uniref:uncharacterized protein LOC130936088 n=1 Tax=Arachis stenosperma TaxID=217475 RepID=UPI0025ABE419|nr:uncharacterized protein LOC130936088 [Arachis stenosperma]XP_057739445.1 uncharacterized protein LOC130956423 [Arachis stenosperma]